MQDLCDLDLDLDLFKALVYIDCSSKNGETMVCTKMDVHVHALTIYFQDVLSTVLLSFVVTAPKEKCTAEVPTRHESASTLLNTCTHSFPLSESCSRLLI